MSALYKDMALKIKYYKEEVIKSFVKKGYFPLEDEIQNRLSNIDFRTALFETYISKEGSYFNTAEVNKMFELIYLDLKFLYEILEDILINDYNSLKSHIETHMKELENKAKLFEERFNEEINSTSFGKTIFFKANNWDIETKDEYTIINLGQISLIEGSKIALFANIDNMVADAVSFKLITSDTNKSFNALPYNYNNSTYTVPGVMGINRTELKLNGHVIINDYVNINYETNLDNKYKILGGNKLMSVTYKDDNHTVLTKFAFPNASFITKSPCYIEFYYIDGDIIEYNFNKRPNHCNFSISDGNIKVDSDIKKVFIDAPSNFVCNFNFEKGKVYASCEDGIINSPNSLLYSGNWDLRDFEIREYVKSNKTTYDFKLYIKSNNDIKSLIKNVYIKEID